MESVCAGIVLYNPDTGRLKQVLEAVIPQCPEVVLLDNGSDNLAQITSLAEGYRGISLIELGENRGIATALNIICGTALDEGLHFVLTLDQDTVIEAGMVRMLESQMKERIGIVCPRVSYEGNEKYQPVSGNTVEEIDWAITSGSLTSLEAWEDVSGFDERMFIDGVDKDFCLRLGRQGWIVRRVNDAVIHHRLGELYCRRVFGRTVYATNHPAWRRYYMARNHVYLCRKGLVGCGETTGWLLKGTAKVLLFEPGGVENTRDRQRPLGWAPHGGLLPMRRQKIAARNRTGSCLPLRCSSRPTTVLSTSRSCLTVSCRREG